MNTTLDAPQSPAENNFSSPYYPMGFPMNMTCGWFITAPVNHTVKLQLTSRLRDSFKSLDRVEIYDVDGLEHSVNRRLSNPSTVTIFSKFRSLYVMFKSDGIPQESVSEQGITVTYTAIKLGEIELLNSSCWVSSRNVFQSVPFENLTKSSVAFEKGVNSGYLHSY